MIGGSVSHVRELTSGVQADVLIGATGKHGYVSVRVTTQDPDVLKALDGLKAELRRVAGDAIAGAQADEQRRGRTPLGVVDPRGEVETMRDEARAVAKRVGL